MRDLLLNALRAFAAVYSRRGVRAAARELGVVHSSLSRHLAELERWLGVRLVREGRGSARMSFTPQGEALGQAVLAGLRSIEHTVASLREAKSQRSVTISTAPSFAARWLLPRLPALEIVTGLERSTGSHPMRRPGRRATFGFAFAGVVVVAFCGCAEQSRLPVEAGIGPNPTLPPPDPEWIPTVHIAPARGWSEGERPVAAPGLSVEAFATGLDHPRWLHVLPNGDVLVAETAAPPRPEDTSGLRGWIMTKVMERAGSAVPSADRITLLRDIDGDGIADVRSVFLEGLRSPFGMALVGEDFYVANTDALLRFRYEDGATWITGPGEKIVDLPAGPINRHWTRNVIANPQGTRLYVTVGSNSNIGENGMEAERDRACILEVDPATKRSRVFASGLRNPNGLDWHPETGELWTVVNERDGLGGDLVPDYLTSVVEGGFYGWPYSYFGRNVDERVEPQRPDLVARAIVPDYALGAHTSSIGLVFHRGGAFVGQHGSWNRRPRSGYKVIFVPFEGGRPAGQPQDVLAGFVNEKGEALGRPVGVAVDRSGALLVADDVGNTVWRVTFESSPDSG